MPRSLASEMSGRARRATLDLRVEPPTSWPLPRKSASSSDFTSAAEKPGTILRRGAEPHLTSTFFGRARSLASGTEGREVAHEIVGRGAGSREGKRSEPSRRNSSPAFLPLMIRALSSSGPRLDEQLNRRWSCGLTRESIVWSPARPVTSAFESSALSTRPEPCCTSTVAGG